MKTENNNWRTLTTLLESGASRTTYIYGPPGTGKTYIALKAKAPNGVVAITLTEDTPVAELRGHYIPKGQELVWRDGPVTSALRKGQRLVLNEVTHAPAEVWSFLYPVMEDPSTAVFTLPTGEEIRPHPEFRLVATDNEGPEQLPEALRDRFDATVHIQFPHPNAFSSIPEPWGGYAKKCSEIEDGRKAPTLREWNAISRLAPEIGSESAIRVVLHGRGEAEGLIQSVMVGGAI